MSQTSSPELLPAGAYPAAMEADVLLSDGTTAHLRPIRPEDAPSLIAFHARLSAQSIYRRFFSAHPRLSSSEVEHFTQVDYVDRLALVAEVGNRLVAVARYDRLGGRPEAEVAFVVSDDYQGRGLGSLLLEHLAAAGAERGIMSFTAQTLVDNAPMRDVFSSAGFAEQTHLDHDVVEVRLDITPTEESVAAAEQRDLRAAAASIARLLRPSAVAVVGAGREPGGIGHEIFANLLASGFTGVLYPVNHSAHGVAGVRSYSSVMDVPDPVDLAVISVPASDVPAVIDDCGRKGVTSVVVVSAGFAETGAEGATAEHGIAHLAHRLGMRLVGPNCLGVANLSPSIALNATFAPTLPPFGTVGLASQSGGIGIAIFEQAAVRGLGLSSFVSLGNKADVSGNDLLAYWKDDPSTQVILLYLESFGNPRRFIRLARAIGRRKPIVVVRGGRSPAGVRGAGSHTGALASPELVVEAALSQAGVIRADSLGEMLDLAEVLASQPIPNGRRVAIVGNAGGPGILTADACEAAGLEVPELGEHTQQLLREAVPAGAAVSNPVDLLASARAEDYEHALQVVLADPGVDSAIVVFAPPLVTRAEDVARAVARAAGQDGIDQPKPVLAAFLATPEAVAALSGGKRPIPCFAYPEASAIALGKIAGHGAWRGIPDDPLERPEDIDLSAARDLVAKVLADSPEGRWLDPMEGVELLEHYRIAVAKLTLVDGVDAACVAASDLGYPVALKAFSPGLVHKSDSGGVRLGLPDENRLREAWGQMAHDLGSSMTQGVIQAMAPPGVETIAGIIEDQVFGPLVLFGLGGTAVEILGDHRVHLAPLTTRDASAMIHDLAGFPLLNGYRGAPAVDLGALESTVVRLGWLADDLPQVAEADLNPVVATPGGALALDVKIRVAPLTSEHRRWVRRLA
jgi:acetyl coenzyme A synthetase (ADP forming)-like protein